MEDTNMKMRKLVTVLACATVLAGSAMTVSAAPLPEAPAFELSSLEGVQKVKVYYSPNGEFDGKQGVAYDGLGQVIEPDLSEVTIRDVYLIPVGTQITIPADSGLGSWGYDLQRGCWFNWCYSDYTPETYITTVRSQQGREYFSFSSVDCYEKEQGFCYMSADVAPYCYFLSDDNSSVTTPAYTVTDVSAVLYTCVDTTVYADAALDAQVVLPAVGAKLPVLVTGITSSGFFRVDLGTGLHYYIPGYGLTVE